MMVDKKLQYNFDNFLFYFLMDQSYSMYLASFQMTSRVNGRNKKERKKD